MVCPNCKREYGSRLAHWISYNCYIDSREVVE